MGKYTGYTIFKEDEIKFWGKALVRFFQIVMISYTLQMAWSAYFCRHDFLKFIYYFLFFISCIQYSCFQLTWINREDKVDKLLKWCQRQRNEPAYRLLDEWPENYYKINRLVRNVLIGWTFCIDFWAGGFFELIGSVMASFYFKKYTLIVPNLVIIDDELTTVTFVLALVEEYIFFFSVCASIGIVFLTLYFTVIYLLFRCDAIEELIKKVGNNITDQNRCFDQGLLKMIVDLHVDANE